MTTDDHARSSMQQVVLRRGEITDDAGSGVPLGVGGVFEIVYADPPWRYNSGTVDPTRKIENHYPTMSIAEICALKVPVAKDAILYLWATAPLLIEALDVVKAWGFRYKTHAVWDKKKIGIGFWFRGQHELLIVGVRGDVKPPDPTQRVPSVIYCPRGPHSAKPDRVRDWIAEWYPRARKLEMFSRLQHAGWHSFGNQCEHDLFSRGFEECASKSPKGKDCPRHDATENAELSDSRPL